MLSNTKKPREGVDVQFCPPAWKYPLTVVEMRPGPTKVFSTWYHAAGPSNPMVAKLSSCKSRKTENAELMPSVPALFKRS